MRIRYRAERKRHIGVGRRSAQAECPELASVSCTSCSSVISQNAEVCPTSYSWEEHALASVCEAGAFWEGRLFGGLRAGPT